MAIGTTAALIGASVAGSAVQAIGAKKGADAQADAAASSNALQKYIYDDSKKTAAPWVSAGEDALGQMLFELGLGPQPGSTPEIIKRPGKLTTQETQVWNPSLQTGGGKGVEFGGGYETELQQVKGPNRFKVGGEVFGSRNEAQAYVDGLPPAPGSENPFEKFRNTPGYQFQLEEGQQAIERNAAARGMSSSGAFAKDLSRFSQGLADQSYGNYWNRLANMAGQGQTQVQSNNALGQNYANAVGQNNRFAGNAKASGYQNQANAFTGLINNGASIWGAHNAGYFG